MALRNVLGHAAEHSVDGGLLFLDQEKAYDRISHPYLSAVLSKFGFSPTLQHAFAATYSPTSAFFLDDGHPVGPVTVACGVRQGDPLAPLLFNLAFEPLLATLRSRLQGLRLPWGVFIVGAFADDVSIGLLLSDGTILIAILDAYCRASNSRINFSKSVYMPLSSTATLPPWAVSLGLSSHNPLIPIRVLGYDLVLSPDGVSEDWDQLYTKLESVSRDILSRHLTLQGRSLVVSSKLLSRLWYKFRLSSPPSDALSRFSKLAWSTVWNNRSSLAPPLLIGRRSRLQGGLNFLSTSVQATALQASWISTLFTRPTIWSASLLHALREAPGGVQLLTTPTTPATRNRLPVRWRTILQAWSKLRPHWNPDITAWSPAQALAFPLPGTFSRNYPDGIPLHVLLSHFSPSLYPTLLPETVLRFRFRDDNPTPLISCLRRIHAYPSSLLAQLVHLVCSLPSSSLPSPASPSSLFTNLLVANDIPASQLTTSAARRFLDEREHVSTALDWNTRSISRLAVPPPDIWSRVWRSPLLPRHRTTWYKLLMNALPLGQRIFHFAPESLLCHACPSVQSLYHFVYGCPLAHTLWSELQTIFNLPSPVSLTQALFSWPSGGSRFLGREFGYRLQAGHAVVVHTLWVTHCEAVYDDVPSSRIKILNRFRYYLRQHFLTLVSSPLHRSRLGVLPPFFSSV